MKNKVLWIVLAVAAVIALWLWTSYNRLIMLNEQVDNQWAQVEAQYQRRFDLIPNLVESVRGAMGQEQAVFGDLAEARANYAGARDASDKAAAAGQVESAFGRLLAVMENYPDLRSTETVQTLMAQLEGTENRISAERGRFNEQVRNFNVITKRFPTSLLARLYGFEEKNYFNVAPGVENAPRVDLNIERE